MEYPIVLAFLAFLSTTLDDFAVILIFFGREFVKTNDICNSSTRHDFGSIILGQILAFTIITAISLVIGFGLRKTVSDSYIDLIGFLPILIGLYKVFEILHEDGYLSKCWDCLCCKSRKKLLSEEAEGEIEPLVDSSDNGGVLGSFDRDSLSHRISSAYGSSGLFEKTNPMQDGLSPSRYRGDSLDHLPDVDAAKPSKSYACWRNPLLEEVLLFGLLFGVDNISIYVSLFSNSTDADILVTVIVFYVLLLFYIGVAIAVITKVSHCSTRLNCFVSSLTVWDNS
jgi:cadmium resistance protein CadD (predicted permease)